jgi:predicted nucleic acid-binding protein
VTVTIVVDASAIAAILFEEPAAVAIRDRIEGETLLAPDLLATEIANACVTRQRRFPNEQSAVATYAVFVGWNIRMLPVAHAEVVALAAATGLTAYDACYLWLARDLAIDLVTLDRRLIAFAPRQAPDAPG